MENAHASAPEIRRPAGLTLIALLSNAFGLVTALAALLWAHWEGDLTRGEMTLVAVAAICGCGAVVASIGLVRLSPQGRSLQVLVSVLWLIGAVAGVGWADRRTTGWLVALLAFGALPAALALFYLTRTHIAELFRIGSARRAGGRLLVADAVVIVLAVFLLYPILRTMSGRSNVKRTMADLRSIATALEAYSTDYDAYPAAESFEELIRQISPTYLREVPTTDAWDTPLRYEAWSNDGGRPQHFGLASAGADREFEHLSVRVYDPPRTREPGSDLVFGDGEFIGHYDETSPPPDSGPRNALEQATALYRAERYSEAIPLYRQHLGSQPDDDLSYARLAFSLIQMERWEEAVAALEREIELAPTSYKGLNNLALVHEKLDAIEPALVAAREAVRLMPDDATTQNTLGFILIRSGDYQRAIEHLRISRRLDPTLASAILNLGRAYALSGDTTRAKEELAALTKIDPGSAAALQAEIDDHGSRR